MQVRPLSLDSDQGLVTFWILSLNRETLKSELQQNGGIMLFDRKKKVQISVSFVVLPYRFPVQYYVTTTS